MTCTPDPPPPKGPSPRIDAALGALLALVAIAIVVTAEPAWNVGAILTALLVGGLGLEAMLAARQGRRSVLSRIGPLP